MIRTLRPSSEPTTATLSLAYGPGVAGSAPASAVTPSASRTAAPVERVRERADVGARRGLEDVGGDALPGARRPWARSITVTSPSASSPSVTAETVYWRSSHSVSTASRIAPKIASTGPSPEASPTDSSPEGSAHRDARVRLAPRAGLDLEPGERVGVGALAHLVGDDRLEVERGHLLLLVGDLLEALERLVQGAALDLEAELLERVAQRVAARSACRARSSSTRAPTSRRVHDLVRRPLLQHSVLVDAGLVRERVAPDDGLVRLHRRSR